MPVTKIILVLGVVAASLVIGTYGGLAATKLTKGVKTTSFNVLFEKLPQPQEEYEDYVDEDSETTVENYTTVLDNKTISALHGDFFALSSDKWDSPGKGGSCVFSIFGATSLDGSKENNDEFKKAFEEDNKEKIKKNGSCFFAAWKQSSKNDYWKGFLKFDWSFRSGNQGVFLFGGIRNSATEAGKVDLYLKGFYVKTDLSKRDAFKVHHHIEKRITNIDTDIPQDKNGIANNFSGFNLDTTKACANNSKEEDCNFDFDDPEITKEERHISVWKHSEEETENTEEITKWSSNFNDWWNKHFESKLPITGIADLKGSWSTMRVM